MAVSVEKKIDTERLTYYEITLSANGDVAQVWLRRSKTEGVARALEGFDWFHGMVSWYKTASVTATFTNAGPDAMALDSSGNGEIDGWVAHPDNGERQASETLPITGLRFTASAADQTVLLYTGEDLLEIPYDAGTPA